MSFKESAVYFVLFVGLCLAGLYNMLSGAEATGMLYAACLLGLVVVVVGRVLWIDAAPDRAHKKFVKELHRDRAKH